MHETHEIAQEISRPQNVSHKEGGQSGSTPHQADIHARTHGLLVVLDCLEEEADTLMAACTEVDDLLLDFSEGLEVLLPVFERFDFESFDAGKCMQN